MQPAWRPGRIVEEVDGMVKSDSEGGKRDCSLLGTDVVKEVRVDAAHDLLQQVPYSRIG